MFPEDRSADHLCMVRQNPLISPWGFILEPKHVQIRFKVSFYWSNLVLSGLLNNFVVRGKKFWFCSEVSTDIFLTKIESFNTSFVRTKSSGHLIQIHFYLWIRKKEISENTFKSLLLDFFTKHNLNCTLKIVFLFCWLNIAHIQNNNYYLSGLWQ